MYRPPCEKPSKGAQRLAASKIVSLELCFLGFPQSLVLNALRHQRSFHSSTTAKASRRSGAQRLAASKIVSHISSPLVISFLMCSTPCGIKDRFTSSLVLARPTSLRAQRLAASKIVSRFRKFPLLPLEQVLNALRHQRSFHC